MNFSQRGRLLNYYFLLSYLIILGICSGYLKTISLTGTRTIIYVTAVYLSYSLIYLLPAIFLTRIIHSVQYRLKKDDSGRTSWLVYATAIFSVGITVMVLLGDYNIYNIYNFHFNGFVWNLITAPGGIESMGGSTSTYMVIIAIICGIFSILGVSLWTIGILCRRRPVNHKTKSLRLFLCLLILFITLGFDERITYGISQMQAYTPVLTASSAFPFYMPMTFSHLAKKLGYKVHREKNLRLSENSKLLYPLKPLILKKQKKLPNIVMLVSESWRWDMLNPEISPATWAFAQKAHQFRHNYSSGNGTRMGIFGLFYGLYGPYWFPFLNARQSPVLMDTVQKLGYQISMYTSASFSYPEFGQTVLAKVPDKSIHAYGTIGAGWERDRKNVGDLLTFIKTRNKKQPFFTFMFFESPHARYYFPPESIIRKNYLKDFNYATASLDKDIGLIKNRYINSCHYLDSQFKRIFDFLSREKLLDNTIVILTGDHGEEFMEKGRWGHNSEFHEEQTRTPMVVWAPGTGSSISDRITSHLDVAPTLLSLLGVTNPASDYSLGHNLLSNYQRQFTIIGDWSRVAYVGQDYKLVIPFKRAGFIQPEITTRDDVEKKDFRRFLGTHKEIIPTLMANLSLFQQHK
ncbi:MAG: sulfatase-like hydrolase/transferase [Deltaproteobacteria bacterium]|nr:sulfatase-like hydrolase/transferase [Deltaproteobacteria bacterium]